MAKDRTEKSKYESRYSESFVSGLQYITELICEKKARTEGKDLPIRFWQLEDWAKFFKSQVNTSSKLIKKYGEKAIIAALMDNRSYKTYSLRSPWLEKLIIEYHNKFKIQEQLAEKNRKEKEGRDSQVIIGKTGRKELQSDNRLNKLMDME